MYTRHELRQLVLDVELILISVVQGVALTALAVEAAPMLRTHHFATYVFVATGILFVLSFWSAALVHAVSFLSWPMDLVHYFFYFGLALLECLLFAQMERPRDWFGYSLACFVLVWALYLYDYRIILRRRPAFEDTPAHRALYTHIVRAHRFEMLVLMPAGLAFNLAAYLMVVAKPESATTFAVLQLAFTLMFVITFVRSFNQRQRLITTCANALG